MITVKVTYTVKPEFAAQNQENIRAFMADFQKMKDLDFQYSAYICGDDKTFVHLSQYANEITQHTILAVPSFKHFQEQRDASGLENDPHIEVMTLVGSSSE